MQKQLQPLQKGDHVMVLSPSGKVEEIRVRDASNLLTNWGLKVEFGPHTFDAYNKLAGTDANRLSDLQYALDNPNIKAVFCSRGGYGLVRIIDQLNWRKFTDKPKLIIGFSDITVLHNQVHQLGFKTLHAPMPNSYSSTPNEVLAELKNALFESNYQYNNPLFKNNKVVGGNLAIVYSLLGTNSDIDTSGKVLFLEDIGEYAYQIDRMMHGLKKAGKLANLKGLALGYFTNIKDDNFGFSVKEIIDNLTSEYDYPVVYNIKAGHEDKNYPIVLG